MDQAPLQQNEAELVQLLKLKSYDAFNCVYTNYAKALYNVIYRIVQDAHTSEDVLQEVFVKVWSKIDQYDAAKGRVFTWMLNIAVNAARDILRSKGEIMKRKIHAEYDMHQMPAGSSNQKDSIGLQKLVSKLSPDCRTVINMAYFQGFTTSEISQTLSIPHGTVKTRMRKALSILRSDFQYSMA